AGDHLRVGLELRAPDAPRPGGLPHHGGRRSDSEVRAPRLPGWSAPQPRALRAPDSRRNLALGAPRGPAGARAGRRHGSAVPPERRLPTGPADVGGPGRAPQGKGRGPRRAGGGEPGPVDAVRYAPSSRSLAPREPDRDRDREREALSARGTAGGDRRLDPGLQLPIPENGAPARSEARGPIQSAVLRADDRRGQSETLQRP